MSTSLQFEPDNLSAAPGGAVEGTLIIRNDAPISNPTLEVSLAGREEIVFFAGKGYAAPHAELPGVAPRRIDLRPISGAGPIPAGVHQVPVSLGVPSEIVPSFPNEKSFRSVGIFPSANSEGLYVEYWLDISLRTGLLSHSRIEVPVSIESPNYELGWVPQSDFIGQAGNVNVRLFFPNRRVLAGGKLEFRWALHPHKVGEFVRLTEVGFGLRVDSVGGVYGHLRQFRRAEVSESLEDTSDPPPTSGTASLSLPEWFSKVAPRQGAVYLSSWEVYLKIESPHVGILSGLPPRVDLYYVGLAPPTGVERSSGPLPSDRIG